MSQTESTILSTSIVTITNDLGGYGKSSWVFTAYFVTYSGLLIIWAKLSDIFGRKLLLVVALLLFIIFSAACGASQTFLELIMFRWVLGFGGSGIYSIATLVFFELVPPSKYADYVALVTAVIALSVVSGPLLGGAISSHGRWRWVFLLNVPIGSVALLLLMLIMPKRLRTEPSAAGDLISSRHGFAPRTLKRIDFLGGFLLLGANVLIVTALEQATAGVSFAAREILPLLILAAVLWCAFLLWQWYATAKCVSLEPVLPFRLLTNRVFLGMILNTFFTGTILAVCIVQLPQRFMTVNEYVRNTSLWLVGYSRLLERYYYLKPQSDFKYRVCSMAIRY
jgi:MFS family permease